MMYNTKFITALKSNGKVLKEFKDICYLPFGAEYSILLKNLNSVRALVRVSIDGTDIAEGTSFVINANSELELTRFIKNGNLKAGNKFKFIERTDGIEKHRGIKAEDGIVQVSFQFEKPVFKGMTDLDYLKLKIDDINRKVDQPWPFYHPPYPGYYPYAAYPTIWFHAGGSGGTTGGHLSGGTLTNTTASAVSSSISASLQSSVSLNNVGITVPGSSSEQLFSSVSSFPVEAETHVMIIKIIGETEQGQVIVKAVEVKSKPKCTICGHVNKASNKFCSECGTALTII